MMFTEAKWMMAASAEMTIVVNASTSICCMMYSSVSSLRQSCMPCLAWQQHCELLEHSGIMLVPSLATFLAGNGYFKEI